MLTTTIGAIRNSLENPSKNSNPSQVVSPKRLGPREDSKLKKLDSQCDSYDPAEDEHKEALQAINDLAAENEKLRESIALGNLDLPEEKKLDLAAQLQELRKNLEVSEATNKTISISRDTYMNRCSELISKVKKLQYVLNRKDKEIESLKEELARATKKVEITEGGSDFERAMR
jgi:chromosome segregation ATPase